MVIDRVLACLAITCQAIGQNAPPDDEGRPVSWKELLPNIASDQKQIWMFPARLARGNDLLPAAGVLGVTAGLLAADPVVARDVRGTTAFHGFSNIFGGNATAVGTALVPAALYAAGLWRQDNQMKRTALLAAESVVDAEIVATVLKQASGRLRPVDVPARGNFADTWYEGGHVLRNNGSFPSGHTIAAFSIATVVARRYSKHHWVPYAAYGAAALVGFSRVTSSAHFLSDVFVGGALGYSIGRFVVLRQ